MVWACIEQVQAFEPRDDVMTGESDNKEKTGINPDSARAFERDYRESFALVYNYVFQRMSNREATEDVVAKAFLNAARFYHRFDSSRAKFSTWVISIARNCISDHYAHELSTSQLDDVPESAYAIDSHHDEVLGDRDLVARLLSSLDADERELVFLKYYEGKRNVEIAELLDINPSTVSTRLARALAKMRASTS